MATSILVIDLTGGIGGTPIRCTYLFTDFETAEEVHARLVKAATDYHGRANDRERMVTFNPTGTVASVDVSSIAAIGIDHSMGDAKEAHEEWAAHVGHLHSLGTAKPITQ